MLKLTLATVAVVAVTAVTSGVSAYTTAGFTAAQNDCKLYGGRAPACSVGNKCRTAGDNGDAQKSLCTFRCPSAGTRDDCTYANRTVFGANACVNTYQDDGTTFVSCAYDCAAITNVKSCWNAGCTWFDGVCQTRCGTPSDSAACNNTRQAVVDAKAGVTTICNKWNGANQYFQCEPNCGLMPSKYFCNLQSGCSWNLAEGKCGVSCTNFGLEQCVANNKNGCVWLKGSCGYDCSKYDNLRQCAEANCQWGPKKGGGFRCERKCSSIQIPSPVNFTGRQTCLEQELCGGETSCRVANCTLYKNFDDCYYGSGQQCNWFGPRNNGECRLDCISEFQRKGTCTTKTKDDKVNVCSATTSGAGAVIGCNDVLCGNFTKPEDCKAYWGDCYWLGKRSTGKCVPYEDSCFDKSATVGAPGLTACDNATDCTVITRGATNNRYCISRCDQIDSQAGCQSALSCVWIRGKCKIACNRFFNETECKSPEASEQCFWVNSTLNPPSCKPRCELFEGKEACEAGPGECKHYGDSCGCRTECEQVGDGPCNAPCYRNSKLGDICTSPAIYASTDCDDALSPGAIAGIVIGVVAFVIIVGVILFFAVGGSSAAAAGTAGAGTAVKEPSPVSGGVQV